MPLHGRLPKHRRWMGPRADAVACLGMPKDSGTGLRDTPASRATSPSEEMYLITVALAEEPGGGGRFPVAALAQTLSISPVSANQMVWRLAKRGLMDYHPYQGVVLTAVGRAAARRVLRGRRLWASFLVDHLGFGEEEADALACDFEHLTSPRVADRLEGFLESAPEGDGRR
jgi:DtxR family Mn-dependent transcriptional regulator